MTLNLTCMIVKKKSIVVKIALSYSHSSVDSNRSRCRYQGSGSGETTGGRGSDVTGR